MTLKKKLQWFGIFLLLSAFTFSTVSAALNSEEEQMAEAFAHSKINKKVVVSCGKEKENKGLWGKIENLYEDEELCTISEEQLSKLSEKRVIEIKDLVINGEQIKLAEIKGKISKKELSLIIGEENLDCKVAKKKNFFFMLFSPQIS